MLDLLKRIPDKEIHLMLGWSDQNKFNHHQYKLDIWSIIIPLVKM